jgi:hypothetical protein
MPEFDANRAQLHAHHHIMMGLGGGAKNASSLALALSLFYFLALCSVMFLALFISRSPSLSHWMFFSLALLYFVLCPLSAAGHPGDD